MAEAGPGKGGGAVGGGGGGAAQNWLLIICEQHRYQGVSYKSDIIVISGE